jgi:hypothetical protein
MTKGLVGQMTPASRKTADQSIAWKCRLWRAAGGLHIVRALENSRHINVVNAHRADPQLPISRFDPFSGTENNVQTTFYGRSPGGLKIRFILPSIS